MVKYWRYAAVPLVAIGVWLGTHWLNHQDHPIATQTVEFVRPSPNERSAQTILVSQKQQAGLAKISPVNQDFTVLRFRQLKSGVVLDTAEGISLSCRQIKDPDSLVGSTVHVRGISYPTATGKNRVIAHSLEVANVHSN